MKPAASLFVLSIAMVGAFHTAALSAAPMPAVAVVAATSGAGPAASPGDAP
ncbi:TPA: hypothetical protein QDC00_004331, partial [Burkholderia stabilis]|nr:hypothetical protein [Burkholderia stabilis]